MLSQPYSRAARTMDSAMLSLMTCSARSGVVRHLLHLIEMSPRSMLCFAFMSLTRYELGWLILTVNREMRRCDVKRGYAGASRFCQSDGVLRGVSAQR
jgi:hypothetical protein